MSVYFPPPSLPLLLLSRSSLTLMQQVQTAAEADGQGAAGVDMSPDMHRGGFPTLDLPVVSWSEPPRDVLECILEKVKEHRDILLFGSVCVAWRSFTLENMQRFPRQLPLARCITGQCQLPLLMLPCRDASKACDFFCVFEQKFYGGTPLPDSNKWIWGSSFGWLVTADIRRGSEIYMFNPISRDQIYLPSKTKIPRPRLDRYQTGLRTFYYLSKAVLSSSPASSDCSVMGIISAPAVLSFCRPGDSKWTNLESSPTNIDDIIYYKDQFYAVHRHGIVVTCDIGPSPKASAIVGGPKVCDVDPELLEELIYMKRYLVESGGELLQVVRVVQGLDDVSPEYRTIDFRVFKLQEKGSEDTGDAEEDVRLKYKSIDGIYLSVENSSYKWVKLDNLCDRVVFLGFNQSFSLPAGALPNSRGNCIYFTDDYMDYYSASDRISGDTPEVCADMGVFDLQDCSVHDFHPEGLVFPLPPIWLTPTPW